LLFLR